MSIWNKVLLGLNILVSFGVFYFALQALNIHKAWRESAQKFEKKLKQVDKENAILKHGPDGKGGIRALEIKLAAEYAGRGRVWYNCEPCKPAGPTLVSVRVTQPKPHNIERDQVVYVFDCSLAEKSATDQNDSGDVAADAKSSPAIPKIGSATFLGEFIVESTGKPIQLRRTTPPSPSTERQIAESVDEIVRESRNKDAKKAPPKRFWVIWEQMPMEFAGKGSRDYLASMKWHEKILDDQKFDEQTLLRHKATLQGVLKDIEQQEKISMEFNKDLLQKRKNIRTERNNVKAHADSLKEEHKALVQQLEDLMNKNRVLAQSLQQFEEEAIMQINSRTASSH